MGCVYLATNRVNGKQYVGKTLKTLSCRRVVHECHSRRESNHYFHCALRKYGHENFDWLVLVTSDNANELSSLERTFINSLNTRAPNGYNLTTGGDGTPGWHHSAETRAKQRAARLGTHPTADTRLRLTAAHVGKQPSPETKRKISAAQTGKRRSAETRARMATAKNGHLVSEDTKAKLRAASIGKRPSPETRAKMSAVKKGRRLSEGAKAKLRTANLGKRHSAETKAKISVANKGRRLSSERMFCFNGFGTETGAS
jgi:group I intron endonuclease